MNFTPRKVIKGIVFVIAFVFLVMYFQNGMPHQNSLGLSGSVTTSQAPSFRMAEGGYAGRGVAMNKMAAYDSVAANEYDGESYAPTSLPIPSSEAPAGVSKIVKTGNLSLLVKSVDTAALAITQLRISLLGQPGNESYAEYGAGGKRGDITIWVPSDKFDEAMVAIKKLALRVDNESVNVQDVSAQYVDLQSRLKNLKASEAQYQDIMKRSGKISEVLEVTRALNDTRAQIEQTQGQMDYLSRQVALSSIHISLTQEAIPGEVVSNEWRPLSVVKAAFRSTLTDLTQSINLFLVLLVRLPVLIVNLGFWALIIWGAYRLGKFTHRRMTASSSTSGKEGV